jgi:hypothetical protein
MFEESRRMDWIVGDVVKTHGTTGMEALMPQPGHLDGHPPFSAPGAGTLPPPMFPGPGVMPSPDGGLLPAPRTVPQETPGQVLPPSVPGAPLGPPPVPITPSAGPAAPTDPVTRFMQQQLVPQPTAPTAPKQEESQWTVMPSRK